MEGHLYVPEDIANPNTEHNDLLSNFGKATLAQIMDHTATYAETNTRLAQNSMMLYQCLSNSITNEVKAKTMLWQNEYNVGDTPCGVAYLKVIIRKAQIHTRATVLDTYISTISYDIVKFNEYVKDLMDSLTARGETTHDLLAKLFKVYKSVKDYDFRPASRKRRMHMWKVKVSMLTC